MILEKLKQIPPHLEVTLRLTLAMFLSYVATFANVHFITPIETNILMGILVPFCALLFPALMFTFGSLILPTFSIFAYSWASATALLAIAVAAGTGWFVAAFALWSFWNCFLRWDKSQGMKVSLILIATVFHVLLIWPTYSTVQNGFVVPSPYLAPSTQAALEGYVADAVQTAHDAGLGTHDITIDSGVLEGRVAYVTISEDGSSSTHIAGGMWMVTGMWIFRGIDNPLATFSNLSVFVCWMIVFLGAAVLSPPFRTMRGAVWRGMIPAALKDAAEIIRLHSAREEARGGSDDGAADEEDEAGAKAKEVEGSITAARGRCIYHMNALFDAVPAKFTFFEPRLSGSLARPIECTGGVLMQLSTTTARAVAAAVGIELLVTRTEGEIGLYNSSGLFLEVADRLDACSKALASGDPSGLDGIVDAGGEGGAPYDAFGIRQRSSEIIALTLKWLGAMSPPPEKQSSPFFTASSLRAFRMNMRPWLYVQYSHFVYLVTILRGLFDRGHWKALADRDSYHLAKLIWCVKYALGFTSLLVMAIYWEGYRQGFVVAPGDDEYRLHYAAQNGGWMIVAYCFATTQTTEGSLRKGLLRGIGTVLGSASAWLALLVCEDDGTESGYSVYGIVAWLTATSFVATWMATERGFASRISLSNDFGFGPIYFIITQIIVVVYPVFHYGQESRDEIAVNRMVSNLSGIAMAALLSLVPPAMYGGDPGHTRLINELHWKTVHSAIELLLSGNEENCDELSVELSRMSEDARSKATKMQEMAADLEKDANRFQRFQYIRVDPRLRGELAKVTRDIYVAAFVPRMASKIVRHEECRRLLFRPAFFRNWLQATRKDMQPGTSSTRVDDFPEIDIPVDVPSEFRMDVEVLMLTVEWLIAEMRGHEKELNQIKWGCK